MQASAAFGAWQKIGRKPAGTRNPIARDIIDIVKRFPGVNPTRTKRSSLGNLAIQEVYVYPEIKPFQFLANGKEAVIRYLEEAAAARSGTPGEYALMRDERG